MMKFDNVIKSIKSIDKRFFISILITSILLQMILISKIGVKDSTTFTFAFILVVFDIYIAKNNIKSSLVLFILSLPILLTARKVFYYDIKLLVLNFEGLYILGAYVFNYKLIIKNINTIVNQKKSVKRFLSLTTLYIIASYISVIFSPNPMKSFAVTTTTIMIPILFMTILIAVIAKDELDGFILTLILSVDLSCFYGIIQIMKNRLFSINLLKTSRDLVTFGYHNPNNFVFVLLIIYSLVVNRLLYYYKNQDRKIKVIYYISFLIQTITIALTFSRGAWLAAIIVFFILLLDRRYKKIWLVLVSLFLVTVKWTIPYILRRGVADVSLFQNESTMARIQALITNILISIKYPFGVGIGNYNEFYKQNVIEGYLLLPESFRKLATVPFYTMELAHNILMQISVEQGIVALILFIILFLNRIKYSLLNFKNSKVYFTALAIYMFLGVTTGIQFNHKGMITPTIILWIIISFSIIDNLDNKSIS